MKSEPELAERLDSALGAWADEVLTPALVIDLDAVDHNARAMLRHVGDPRRWRPHLKTSKQSILIGRLLEAGVRDFKVATLDELELLLATARSAGIDAVDVIVAYPLHGPAVLAFARTRDRYSEHTPHLILDSPEHGDAVSEALAAAGAESRFTALLDVDLGMGRTGTSPERWREAVAGGIHHSWTPIEIVGLHGYDGHHRASERAQSWRAYDRLCGLAEATFAASHDSPPPLLVTSGTHSFAHALDHPGLCHGAWQAQVSPGTVVLSDMRSHNAADILGLRQAAFIVSRVVSFAGGGVTLDAGSKAITPDGAPPTSRVLGWPGLTPKRASEEHLPCDVAEGSPRPKLGQRLWLVPDHVCTTVNLHREALWLRGDAVSGWGAVEASGHRCWAPDSPRRRSEVPQS